MLLDRIELFVKVAGHRNLAKTAREMHVSPSSVCQRLKALENDLGVRLYKRNKDGIEVSEAGQTLLTVANAIKYQLDLLRKRLNGGSQPAVQLLSLGGTYTPSVKYLPSAIASFKKIHPNVKVQLLTADERTLEKLLREFAVDVAMIQNPSGCAEFHTEHFATDNLTFFAHPGHLLAKKKKVGLEDLTRIPLIIEKTHTVSKVVNDLTKRGLKVNIALHCVAPEAVKAAVRTKMGVGILYYSLIEEEIKSKELKAIRICGLTNFVGNTYVVYNNNHRPLSAAGSDFVSFLRSMKPVQLPLNDPQPSKRLVTSSERLSSEVFPTGLPLPPLPRIKRRPFGYHPFTQKDLRRS